MKGSNANSIDVNTAFLGGDACLGLLPIQSSPLQLREKPKMIIKKIKGRFTDQCLDSEGSRIPTYIIAKRLVKIDDLLKFQRIQVKPNKFIIKYVTYKNKNIDEELKKAHKYLDKSFNYKMEFVFKKVKDIPFTKAGKYKSLMSLVKNTERKRTKTKRK